MLETHSHPGESWCPEGKGADPTLVAGFGDPLPHQSLWPRQGLPRSLTARPLSRPGLLGHGHLGEGAAAALDGDKPSLSASQIKLRRLLRGPTGRPRARSPEAHSGDRTVVTPLCRPPPSVSLPPERPVPGVSLGLGSLVCSTLSPNQGASPSLRGKPRAFSLYRRRGRRERGDLRLHHPSPRPSARHSLPHFQ